MTLSDTRRSRRPYGDVEVATLAERVSPDYPHHPSNVPCPLPRRIERVHASIASPLTRPSPLFRRVGIRIFTFEACSGFTHVTARWIAQPPKAAFVTRLRPGQLPNRAARQLPDQSTTLWVESSSTGDTRPRGALNISKFFCALPHCVFFAVHKEHTFRAVCFCQAAVLPDRRGRLSIFDLQSEGRRHFTTSKATPATSVWSSGQWRFIPRGRLSLRQPHPKVLICRPRPIDPRASKCSAMHGASRARLASFRFGKQQYRSALIPPHVQVRRGLAVRRHPWACVRSPPRVAFPTRAGDT